MPNLAYLEKYLESLQQDRARIDTEVYEVEAIIARHSSNGSSPAAPDAPMLPGIAPTRTKPTDRPSFTPKYPGISLGTLVLEALKPQSLDRGELKEKSSEARLRIRREGDRHYASSPRGQGQGEEGTSPRRAQWQL